MGIGISIVIGIGIDICDAGAGLWIYAKYIQNWWFKKSLFCNYFCKGSTNFYEILNTSERFWDLTILWISDFAWLASQKLRHSLNFQNTRLI